MKNIAVRGIAIANFVAALSLATDPGAQAAHTPATVKTAATVEIAASVQAQAGGDITGLITANGGTNNITLTGGDYTITLPGNGPKVQEASELPATAQTIYHGVISGTGTVTVRPTAGGRASLVMTNLNTWSLPLNRLKTWSDKQPFARYQYDGVALNGGKSPWDVDVLHGGTNDPAMTIAKGAVVHLNDLDGGRASIESYVGAKGRGAGAYNHDSIRVDGTLVFTNNHHSPYETTIGPLSGTGDFINHQGGFRMSGTSTISGHLLLYGANINGAWAWAKLTGVSKIYNALDLAYGATPKTIAPAGADSSSPGVELVPQTIYECCYGNAVYNIGAGEVRFTGKYSYSDSQDQLHPALSNPKLNYVAFPKGNSHRIVDLGAGITTFGDGTDADFWLPSGWGNAYIGTHKAYALGFDYNGPVRMNVPINSAGAVDGLNVFIKGSPGNRVIVTQPLYYHGFTIIDPKAVLQIGDGTKGRKQNYTFYNKQISGTDTGIYSTSSGSGRILTADVAPGRTGDRIITNGTLVVANARGAISGVGALSLSDISGRGSLQQRGPATLTLLSHISYRGATTIASGTLALSRSRRGAATLSNSSGVALTGPTAVLDLSGAGAQTIRGLTGVAGSRIVLGSQRLTVNTRAASTFAGSITGGSVVTSGSAPLTLTGKVTTRGPVELRTGSLVVGGTVSAAAGFTQAAGGSLQWEPGGRIVTPGPVTLAGPLTVPGTLTAGQSVTIIDNTGTAAITGGFAGLAEGARVRAGSGSATVSYRGGTGNDVVLTGVDGVSAGSNGPAGGLGLVRRRTPEGGPGSGGWVLGAGLVLAAGSLIMAVGYLRKRRSTPRRHVESDRLSRAERGLPVRDAKDVRPAE